MSKFAALQLFFAHFRNLQFAISVEPSTCATIQSAMTSGTSATPISKFAALQLFFAPFRNYYLKIPFQQAHIPFIPSLLSLLGH
jgi:hypothetical protein